MLKRRNPYDRPRTGLRAADSQGGVSETSIVQILPRSICPRARLRAAHVISSHLISRSHYLLYIPAFDEAIMKERVEILVPVLKVSVSICIFISQGCKKKRKENRCCGITNIALNASVAD